MPEPFIAYIEQRAMKVHLVRESAEASLCGLPRASLADGGRIFRAAVCRNCIEWLPRRAGESLSGGPSPAR